MTLVLFGLFAAMAMIALCEFAWLHRPGSPWQSGISAEANLIHAAMHGAMAVMALPLYSHGLHRGFIALFAVLLAVMMLRLGWLLSRSRHAGSAPGKGQAIATAGYHVFGLTAMVYALWRMPMAGPICGPVRIDTLPLALALVFGFDGAASLALLVFRPDLLWTARPRSSEFAATAQMRPSVAAIRVLALPHLAMDAAMAVMLLAPEALMA